MAYRVVSSASFLAEMAAITDKNRNSADIVGYYTSLSKVGSVRQPTKIVLSRSTFRYAYQQFFKSPGTASVCYLIFQEI